ncbi:MAG TPA: SpoIIE family protein phosphatase [Rhodopila sp.]|uniref:PP2C family protein-serine/threonine phosphatase n=1 Tax=Rhodopila sp. TaxID=2480087 RepID=UPI002B7402F8|nr:SpoIIE family protein phosphatase [Rhodopila sp.]HVY17268.1 SpoIIE family protein phosphatase [Rhodopila sp.]
MAADDAPDALEQTLMRKPAPAVAPAPVGHFLSFTRDGRTHRVKVTEAGVTIGRHPACDIQFPVAEVSRQHCRVRQQDDAVVLLDLGSTNGTFVAGHRAEGPTPLTNGTQVAIAHFVLRYEQRDLRELEQEARLNEELRQAVDYVRAILPEPIVEGPVRVEWFYVPSSELGGDAFGYQFLDDTTLAGFLLDVSGHGIGAGLHAVNVANTLRRRALPGVELRDPGQVAAGLNAMFPMEHHGGMILTLWYFVYDLATRTLRFCCAGHHPALLTAPSAPSPAPVWLKAPSIGMLPPRPWPAQEIAVDPGSRLYVFSDGAFEIEQPDGSTWRIEDLQAIIASASTGSTESRRIYQAVRAAAKPGPLADDFSVVVLHFG